MPPLPPDRRDWAAAHGLISRADALRAHGPGTLRRLLAPGGPWTRLLPGVYDTGDGDRSDAAEGLRRAAAAVMYAGPRAQVAAATACRLLGLRDVPEVDGVEVLVPWDRQRTSAGYAVVRSTTRLSATWLVGVGAATVPVSPLARASVDAARTSGHLREVRALLCEAVQSGRVPVAALEAEVAAGPSRGRASLRRALADLRAGVRSAPEAEARDLVLASRVLPAPLCNAVLVDAGGAFVARPDGLLWESGTVYEVDSRRHHAEEGDREATMARQVRLEALGLRVVPFSPRQLRRAPQELLARIEQVHRHGLATGPPTTVRVARLADGSPWPRP